MTYARRAKPGTLARVIAKLSTSSAWGVGRVCASRVLVR